MPHPFELERFVTAQAPVYSQVKDELASGRKQSHWMWFIFPQMRGLGRSAMARHFGIASRAEAEAYLLHPLLGARLVECTNLMLAVQGKPLEYILPFPDDVKFISSMTLFEAATRSDGPFAAALKTYAAGARDADTLRLLDGT